MRWHYRLAATLRGWFRSSNIDRDLNEELRFHFDREVEANLARGMTLAQARRSAAITVGNPDSIRDESRDQRTGAWLRMFGRDLAYGLRLLRKAPAFSISAILIIALGIGSVTAIFTVVYGVVLKPLPFRNPESLVQLWSQTDAGRREGTRDGVNGADHRDWRSQNTVFEDIALFNPLANFNLTGDGDPERVLGARISANLLPVLGVSPLVGRNFTEDEDEIGHEHVVLLSHRLWQDRYRSDAAIVGTTIRLAGIPYLVAGVMGPEFQYPGREFQVWVPLTINPSEMARKVPALGFRAIARLKSGVSITAAQSEMDVIAARLADQYPLNRGLGVLVASLQPDMVRGVRTALYVILGAALCLLLGASLNLAGLVGARAAARNREVAVRLALGASVRRVVMQTIAEILPVLVAGGVFGIAAAVLAVRWFVPLAPASMPRVESVAIDPLVLAVSMMVLTGAGLLACVLPAMQAARADVAAGTRDSSRGTTESAAQGRVRNLIVVAQIALSLPLLTSGVLLARTFASVMSVDPGFRTENIATLHLAIPRSKYRDDPAIARFEGQLLDRLRAVPGVDAIGMVNRLPLAGGAQQGHIEFDRSPIAKPMLFGSRVADADYFRAIGIPLIEGRTFTDHDAETAPVVVIVDEHVARRAWPGESAVGKRIRFAVPNGTQVSAWMEVVGVVGGIKHEGLDQDANGQIYWHYPQRTQDRAVFVIRSSTDVVSLIPSIVHEIRQLDPEQPVYDVRTMEEVVARSVGPRWLSMALVMTFATMSVLLCAIGVYGVMAFGVTRQRREFGIRLALGASRGSIATAVLGRGLTLAGIGIGAGLVLAAWLARGMSSMLYGVATTDLISFAIATAAIVIAVAAASYLPARRAAAVDPAVTLRAE